MLTKEKVIQSLENLPEVFSIDELIDKILLLNKIEIGQKQSQSGQIVADENLDEKQYKWLK